MIWTNEFTCRWWKPYRRELHKRFRPTRALIQLRQSACSGKSVNVSSASTQQTACSDSSLTDRLAKVANEVRLAQQASVNAACINCGSRACVNWSASRRQSEKAARTHHSHLTSLRRAAQTRGSAFQSGNNVILDNLE